MSADGPARVPQKTHDANDGRKIGLSNGCVMCASGSLSLIPLAQDCPTLSIPDAGRLAYGASKAASYRMADAGALPTLYTVGTRRLVPTAELRRMLGLDPISPPTAEPPARRTSKTQSASGARTGVQRQPGTRPRVRKLQRHTGDNGKAVQQREGASASSSTRQTTTRRPS